MTPEQTSAAAPIMLRADITRAEVTALRMLALAEGKTAQALVAEIIRERLEKAAA